MARRKQQPKCVAMDAETENKLEICAQNKGESSSHIVRYLINRFICDYEIVPIAIRPDLQKRVNVCAENKGKPVDEYLEAVIDKFVFDENEFIPILLKVPRALKGDRENLENWLKSRVAIILDTFSRH